MKKLLLLFIIVLSAISMNAQSIERMLAASPFQDSLWVLDTTNFSVKRRLMANPSSGSSITGITGIATNPLSGNIYMVFKQNAVSGRMLGTFNPLTALITIIGNLGDNFSSITFSSDGKLFGATGMGATVPKTLYQIDTATAAKRLIKTINNGADGMSICYDSSDNMIYHWSGNGTIVFEKFDTVTGPYNFTDIPIIGTTNGEIFGSLNIGPGKFITSNIGSRFNHFYSNGVVSAQFGGTPDDVRGLVMITCPRSITGPNGYCIGNSADISASPGATSYQWYKNGILLSGENAQTLTVSSVGLYNCILSDACGSDSGAVGKNIQQFSLPIVSVSGNTSFCSGSGTLLTGTSGGTSQWYLNGAPIGGANTPTYNATAVGIYNMIKTNLNGCSDSAATGITVTTENPLPVVTLSGTASFCAGDSTVLTGSSGGTSQWYMNGIAIGGATSSIYTATVPGVYNMTKTNVNSCTDSAATGITVVENPLPVVALSGNTSFCSGSNTVLSDSSATGTTQWYMDGSPIGGAINFAYAATAEGVYNMTETDANGCTDSSATGITVSENALPVVTLSGTASFCAGDSTVLTGSSGGTSQWYMNGLAIGGATSSTYTATVEGVYNMTKTNANACTDSSATGITVVENALPDVSTSLTNETITANFSGAISYQWVNCPSYTTASGFSTGQSYTATANGDYAVIIMDGNCTDTSACVTTSIVGLQDYSKNSIIKVYPNPGNSEITLRSSVSGHFVIQNELGQVISSVSLNPQNNFTYRIEGLKSGIYFINDLNSSTHIKIIVAN
jgi:hypothetical protein